MLLNKDPMQRPNWAEIKDHAVWTCATPLYEFKPVRVTYPEQPQFALFALQQYGITDLARYYEMRKQKQHVLAQAGKVDILRLSLNVSKHLAQELEENREST